MKLGDRVLAEGMVTEIVAISYDEYGDTIYTVDSSTKDFYEKDLIEINR